MKTSILKYFALFTIFGLVALFIFYLSRGAAQPEPIDWGHDRCEQCRMVLFDRRFGAELMSKTGKAFKFDSIECLQNFIKDRQKLLSSSQQFVVNFRSGELMIVHSSVFFIDPQLKSPMGQGIIAAKSEDEMRLNKLEAHQPEAPSLSWSDLQSYLEQKHP